MKITRTKTLVGLALTCLALAATTTSAFAAGKQYKISTFDTDLICGPFTTNFWPYLHDTPEPTLIAWTNSGNPAGGMSVDLDWNATINQWDWQDAKCQSTPWGTNGPGSGETNVVNLATFDYLEFDVAVDIANSHTNDAGGYGGIQCIVQTFYGWGNNATNIDTGYHSLGDVTLPATNGWYHAKVPVASWPYTVSVLTFNYHMQQNQAQAIHVKAVMDNIYFTSIGQPPVMSYVKAIRGYNIWQTGGQYDRNSFAVNQDGTDIYMPSGNGNVNYYFTLAAYPTAAAKSNYVTRMYLIPTQVTDSDPDWSEPNVIMMDLTTDTNNIASWIFRWKTNAANDNGNLYQANAQIVLTNPTPLGKWTLSFSGNTSVTMTAPGGNVTNFVMGTHPNVPDISGLFADSPAGEVYWGSYASGGNHEQLDLLCVYSQVGVSNSAGGFLTARSADWTTSTTFDTNSFHNVPTVFTYMVPTNNGTWVNWTLPDGGFGLQTNSVNTGNPNAWTTSNVPVFSTFPNHHGILSTPSVFGTPTKQLLFRLCSPSY